MAISLIVMYPQHFSQDAVAKLGAGLAADQHRDFLMLPAENETVEFKLYCHHTPHLPDCTCPRFVAGRTEELPVSHDRAPLLISAVAVALSLVAFVLSLLVAVQ